MDLNYLKNLAVESAINAGDFLNKNKDKDKEIFLEEGRDIKIKLDRDTEKLIIESLRKSDIPFQGEELGGENKGLRWVIDPIDGTANYFRGLDQCCVSIALMEDLAPLIGVIFNFNNNDLYTAVKDDGAYLNNKKIVVSNINSKSKASITTGFPVSETIESSLDFLDDLRGWKKVRMFGSAALSCAYVASGKCDYYAERGVYLWDIAAGICLVQEAGGCADLKSIDEERYEVVFSNNLL